MLSQREHLAGAAVLAALLGIATDQLARWFEPRWAVAIGLVVLFVPLFVVAHLIGAGIVWVYRRRFENQAEPAAAPDRREIG